MSALDQDLLPKVTPWLLREADSMCTRRLHAEYSCEPSTSDPVNRGRVRETFIDALRTWADTRARPEPAAFLEPEEHRVVDHALTWYAHLFPGFASETIDLPATEPTELPRRRLRLGGWVDLCVVRADGERELRQLAFGASRTPESVLDVPATRLAILRLAQLRWVEAEPLHLTWVDVLAGITRTATVTLPEDLGPLGEWLDERLAVVDSRVTNPEPTPGRDCTTCGHVPRCPAHEVRGSMSTRKGDLLPAMLTLTPTTVEAWTRCRREWRNRALLQLPPSDAESGTSHGLYMHDLLRFVHERGSCHDERHVAEVLAAHGADARAGEEITRHSLTCPTDARSLGNEKEWVRARPEPPVFLASARLDAVWLRSDVIEVRDYKTGARPFDAVRDDVRARLQAWVAAPRARAQGKPLRIRYEHVAAEIDEDPDPWEPDDEELERVDEELRVMAGEMRAEREFKGVADELVCRSCRYRSICPDSASPSEPTWPAIDDSEVLVEQPG